MVPQSRGGNKPAPCRAPPVAGGGAGGKPERPAATMERFEATTQSRGEIQGASGAQMAQAGRGWCGPFRNSAKAQPVRGRRSSFPQGRHGPCRARHWPPRKEANKRAHTSHGNGVNGNVQTQTATAGGTAGLDPNLIALMAALTPPRNTPSSAPTTTGSRLPNRHKRKLQGPPSARAERTEAGQVPTTQAATATPAGALDPPQPAPDHHKPEAPHGQLKTPADNGHRTQTSASCACCPPATRANAAGLREIRSVTRLPKVAQTSLSSGGVGRRKDETRLRRP